MVERNLRLRASRHTPVKHIRTPKLFVLDTNVLMHDPTSLFRFEEHDIFLPILTLEELDNNKKGTTEVARNARQASRYLDELVTAATRDQRRQHRAGIPLKPRSGGAATGRLFLQTEAISTALPPSLAGGKADNQIICRGHAPAQRASRSAASSWCRRTSTCASRRMRWESPPRTTSTTRCSRTPTSSTAACASCPRISGTATARAWNRGSRAATPTTASPARCAASLLVNEFVYQEAKGRARRRCTRW